MVKKSKKKEDETKKGSRKMRQPWRGYRKLRPPRDLSQSIWYREADCYSKNRYMLIGYKDEENDTHTSTRTSTHTSSIDI